MNWRTNSDTPLTPGLHILSATAWDAGGHRPGTSKAVVINVLAGSQVSVLANNDAFNVLANSASIPLPVLTNDLPQDGSLRISYAGTATATGGTGLGSVSVSYDGTYLVYTPLPNYYGTNILKYAVTNRSGGGCEASVTVRIPGCPPVVEILSPAFTLLYTNAPVNNLAISGRAFDWDGTVTSVKLFTNGVQYGAPITPTGTNCPLPGAPLNPGSTPYRRAPPTTTASPTFPRP